MLEEMLRYINNRFDKDSRGVPYGSESGTFAIDGGAIEIEGLSDGQYFWIEGSVLNDGLHKYPADDLQDEVFDGKVVFLKVPQTVIGLAEDAEQWLESNSEALNGPYQSESFGGYSYSLGSGGAQGNELPASAWQIRYGAMLRPWRKLSRDWV